MRSDGSVFDPVAIRERRRYAGLKQTVLARKVGISPAHMCNIEGGKVKEPGVNVIAAIARELGCTVADLEQTDADSWPYLPVDDWYHNFGGVKAAKAARALSVSPATVSSWARRGLIRFENEGTPDRPSYVYCWADIQELAAVIDGHPRPSLHVLIRRIPANQSPRVLARALNRVRAVYDQAMHDARLPNDTVSKIHAQANRALAPHIIAEHPPASR